MQSKEQSGCDMVNYKGQQDPNNGFIRTQHVLGASQVPGRIHT